MTKMKQNEVKIGESYLFRTTSTEHKKDMIGTIVKVVGSKPGSRKYVSWRHPSHRSPKRFKLDNGRWANAGELAYLSFDNKFKGEE